MKKIFIILLVTALFGASQRLYSQIIPLTDREILLQLVKQQSTTDAKIDKLSEKMDKLTEQQIATTLEIKVITTEMKGMQENIKMLYTLILATLAGVFGMVAMVFWDRRASISPIEEKANALKLENEVLVKEIALLKEKETKSAKKQLKNEIVFKKLFEKFPDLAGTV